MDRVSVAVVVPRVNQSPEPSRSPAVQRLFDRLADRVFAFDPEYLCQRDLQAHLPSEAAVNFLMLGGGREPEPHAVFDRLRWGGVVVYADYAEASVRRFAEALTSYGFVIEQLARRIAVPRLGLAIPPFGRTGYYLVARKVRLLKPGEITERFTYDVFLRRATEHEQRYVVVKRVPDMADLMHRLRHRMNTEDEAQLLQQARKLIDHVFPVFLTREAAFLKLLGKYLPARMQQRVPRLVTMEQDDRGFATRIEMTWLRRSTRTIRQIDFAIQAAELLDRIHEYARIIHLDLRLDNIEITPHGVGFVDFGSAARIGEDMMKNPMLGELFGQILKTSQIQVMLGKMQSLGLVTSETLTRSHQKIDPAADLFYLALQMAKPHKHPWIGELVEYDEDSQEAARIARLTTQVLRPEDPAKPHFTTARQLLEELYIIKKKIDGQSVSRREKGSA